MIRKTLAAFIAATTLVLGVFATTASADGHVPSICTYDLAAAGWPCGDTLAYPGAFTNMPPAPTGPYGWGVLNIAAAPAGDAAGGGATGGTGGGLAHTGGESAVAAYIGTGLVAFGAVALGSRRKFFQGALD